MKRRATSLPAANAPERLQVQAMQHILLHWLRARENNYRFHPPRDVAARLADLQELVTLLSMNKYRQMLPFAGAIAKRAAKIEGLYPGVNSPYYGKAQHEQIKQIVERCKSYTNV